MSSFARSFVLGGGGGGGGGWSRKLGKVVLKEESLSTCRFYSPSRTRFGELHVAHAHRARITKEFYKNLFAPAPGLTVCAVVAQLLACVCANIEVHTVCIIPAFIIPSPFPLFLLSLFSVLRVQHLTGTVFALICQSCA